MGPGAGATGAWAPGYVTAFELDRLRAALLAGPLPSDLRDSLVDRPEVLQALLRGRLSCALVTALLDKSLPVEFRQRAYRALVVSDAYHGFSVADQISVASYFPPLAATGAGRPLDADGRSALGPAETAPRPVLKMKRTGGPPGLTAPPARTPSSRAPFSIAHLLATPPSVAESASRTAAVVAPSPEPARIQSDIFAQPPQQSVPAMLLRPTKVSKGGPSNGSANLVRNDAQPLPPPNQPLGYPLVKIESGDMDGMLYRKRLVGHPFDDSGLDINHASKRPRPDSLNGSSPAPDVQSGVRWRNFGENTVIIDDTSSEDESSIIYDYADPSVSPSSTGPDHEDADSEIDELKGPAAAPEPSNGSSTNTSAGAEKPDPSIATDPKPARPPKIQMACKDRPYNKVLEGQMLISAMGALLPERYEQSTYPDNPWICPIRTCRKVFGRLKSLGGHFPAQHTGSFLNDNGDGTFSVTSRVKSGRPTVVSQVMRLPHELEPLAEPKPSVNTVAGRAHLARADSQATNNSNGNSSNKASNGNSTAANNTAKSRKRQGRKAMVERLMTRSTTATDSGSATLKTEVIDMWKFVQPHLTRTDPSRIPPRGYIPYLLTLPKVRELKWNEPWIARNPFLDANPRDVASLIMQVTGDDAPVTCTKCAEGKGPYAGCVVVTRQAPPEPQLNIISCANCYYHSGQTYCSLQEHLKQRFTKMFPNIDLKELKHKIRREYSSKGLNNLPTTGKVRDADADARSDWGSQATTARPPAARLSQPARRSERLVVLESVAEERNRQHMAVDQVPSSQGASPSRTTSRENSISSAKPPPRAAAGSVPAQDAAHDSPPPEDSPARPPQTMNSDMLEMEDWEIAPGRVRHKSTGKSGIGENIAFSNSYLSSNTMIMVDSDISFHVEVIRVGTKRSFQKDERRTRICSLTTGKLKVLLDSVEFAIGPNGMFKIRPGSVCLVENRLYLDATLHITAVNS